MRARVRVLVLVGLICLELTLVFAVVVLVGVIIVRRVVT